MLRRHLHVRPLLALLPILALVLAAASPNAGAATRAKKPIVFRADPVLVALARATRAGEVTPQRSAELARAWTASARAARTAPSAARRANILATRTYVASLVKRRQLTPNRVEPALLSVKASLVILNSKRAYPSHEAEISVPGEPLVFTYYRGRGVQFQPFESFKRGMYLINRASPDVLAARILADRMLELAVRRNGAVTWEYFFPFGGPATPWTSAISQALGMHFFALVAAATPENERAPYADAAAGIARSFLRSTRIGGVASPQAGGSFYVMYSFSPGQRILNGHLQALLGSYRYWKLTGSALAKQVYDRGRAAAVPLLPRFDTGEWSRYQLGQEAELGYHEFMTDQFKALARETKEPVYAEYYERFRHYRDDPAVLQFTTETWPTVLPPVDRLRDTVRAPFVLDKRARVTLVVTNDSGREVSRVTVNARRGAGGIAWNGRTSRGIVAPAGSYRGRLTVTDRVGNRSFFTLPAPFVVERDTTAPLLIASAVVSAVVRGKPVSTLKIRTYDSQSGYVLVKLRIGGKLVASGRTTAAGAASLRVAATGDAVHAGMLTLTDTSGNTTTRNVDDISTSTESG